MQENKYSFSGHESFSCKSLWLKKGYDFVKQGNNFNDKYAPVQLGVGKNMVSSIRFWLKAFGLTENDELTEIAEYIFADKVGNDPYIEDLGTVWLLHFLLVNSSVASLYNLCFAQFQRERMNFTKEHLQNFVHRRTIETNQISTYTPNTVKRDIDTLLKNYIQPAAAKNKSLDDFSTMLIELDLIKESSYNKTFYFNREGKRQVPPEIFLFGIMKTKGEQMTISFDMMQDVGLIFSMNNLEIIDMAKKLADIFPEYLDYNENAGIRQLQFTKELTPKYVLDKYYKDEEI